MHLECQKHKADFRVVIFPFLHNLGPSYPFRNAHHEIAKFCESKGIRVLDLEPVLSPSADKGLTVNRFDAHPNELAHKLAADAMLKKLLADFATNGNPPRDGT